MGGGVPAPRRIQTENAPRVASWLHGVHECPLQARSGGAEWSMRASVHGARPCNIGEAPVVAASVHLGRHGNLHQQIAPQVNRASPGGAADTRTGTGPLLQFRKVSLWISVNPVPSMRQDGPARATMAAWSRSMQMTAPVGQRPAILPRVCPGPSSPGAVHIDSHQGWNVQKTPCGLPHPSVG